METSTYIAMALVLVLLTCQFIYYKECRKEDKVEYEKENGEGIHFMRCMFMGIFALLLCGILGLIFVVIFTLIGLTDVFIFNRLIFIAVFLMWAQNWRVGCVENMLLDKKVYRTWEMWMEPMFKRKVNA